MWLVRNSSIGDLDFQFILIHIIMRFYLLYNLCWPTILFLSTGKDLYDFIKWLILFWIIALYIIWSGIEFQTIKLQNFYREPFLTASLCPPSWCLFSPVWCYNVLDKLRHVQYILKTCSSTSRHVPDILETYPDMLWIHPNMF